MFKSIKCHRHVESAKDRNFSRVDGFHDVIREFEQSDLSGMKFEIGRL